MKYVQRVSAFAIATLKFNKLFCNTSDKVFDMRLLDYLTHTNFKLSGTRFVTIVLTKV